MPTTRDVQVRHHSVVDVEARATEERDQLRREFNADVQAVTRQDLEDLLSKYEKMSGNINTLRSHMTAFDRLSKAYNKVIGKLTRSKIRGSDKRAAQLEDCKKEIKEALDEEDKTCQAIIARLKGQIKDYTDSSFAARLYRQMNLD